MRHNQGPYSRGNHLAPVGITHNPNARETLGGQSSQTPGASGESGVLRSHRKREGHCGEPVLRASPAQPSTAQWSPRVLTSTSSLGWGEPHGQQQMTKAIWIWPSCSARSEAQQASGRRAGCTSPLPGGRARPLPWALPAARPLRERLQPGPGDTGHLLVSCLCQMWPPQTLARKGDSTPLSCQAVSPPRKTQE